MSCFQIILYSVLWFQRKFARESTDATSDTFKKFRQWLGEAYALGSPSEDDWEVILRDDEEYAYNSIPMETVFDDQSAYGNASQYEHGSETEGPN